MSSLRLNLTDSEAKSVARSFEVLPTGSYLCNVVGIDEKEVSQGVNADKPFWNIHFVVDVTNGKYEGSHIYTNVMLFEGALYSAKQLVESVFPDQVDGNSINIPAAEAFYGKQVVVIGQKFKEGSEIKRQGKVTGHREKDVFEVRGFKPASTSTANKTKVENSLLP